jgi:pilus assembly protein CpaB
MNRRWVIPAVAAVLAIFTTLAVIQYLQSLRKQATVVAPMRMEGVVVAKVDIAERKIVSADLLEVRQIPFTAVHPRAARRIEDVANRVALAQISADEQVLITKLAPAGVNAGLSYVLPKDKRALTIAVNEVIGVAGFVFPGDRVDIVGTVTVKDINISKIVLQDVPVLAVAQNVEQKPGEQPKVTTSATLAVTPDQAEVLAETENNGRVRLALRPTGIADRVETTGKTIEAVLGQAGPRSAVTASAGAGTSAPRPTRRTEPQSGLPLPPFFGSSSDNGVEIWRSTQKSVVHF